MIDAFQQRREEDDQRHTDRINRCLICGATRTEMEDGRRVNFEDHLVEHSWMNLLYFRVYLETQVHSPDCLPIERYAYLCFVRRDVRLFPRHFNTHGNQTGVILTTSGGVVTQQHNDGDDSGTSMFR